MNAKDYFMSKYPNETVVIESFFDEVYFLKSLNVKIVDETIPLNYAEGYMSWGDNIVKEYSSTERFIASNIPSLIRNFAHGVEHGYLHNQITDEKYLYYSNAELLWYDYPCFIQMSKMYNGRRFYSEDKIPMQGICYDMMMDVIFTDAIPFSIDTLSKVNNCKNGYIVGKRKYTEILELCKLNNIKFIQSHNMPE